MLMSAKHTFLPVELKIELRRKINMQFFSTVVIVVVGTFNLVRIFTHKILSDKDK